VSYLYTYATFSIKTRFALHASTLNNTPTRLLLYTKSAKPHDASFSLTERARPMRVSPDMKLSNSNYLFSCKKIIP
jgi:hypothetical protein